MTNIAVHITAKAHALRRPRTIALTVVGILLAWQVLSHSLAAYLAGVAPKFALWLNTNEPEALLNLADQAMTNNARVRAELARGGSTSGGFKLSNRENVDQYFSTFEQLNQNVSVNRPILPEDAAAIRSWAERAVTDMPLNAHALRILGLLAEASNDDASATRFMHAAARVSLHDSKALLWLLEKSTVAKDYKSAIHFADELLRTSPELSDYVVPVLAQIAEDPGSAQLLTMVLARDPPWRAGFFAVLPQSVTDLRVPLSLLSALAKTPAPPTSVEVAQYVIFLVGRKFYNLAYYTWLQSLPAKELHDVGLLFDGDFKARLGVPFDWDITQGSGVTIDVVPDPDKGGAHALLIDFEFGRVDYHSVAELVMLSPGTFAFKGRYKGKLDGVRGLIWRVVCVGDVTAPLGESQTIIGMAPHWVDVDFNFTVPGTNCPAQYVRLDFDARMASEQFITGSILFDDLQISRVSSPPS